jgi:hypothetical protein
MDPEELVHMHTELPSEKLQELVEGHQEDQSAAEYFDSLKDKDAEKYEQLDKKLLGTPPKKKNKVRQKSVSLPTSPFEMEKRTL